MVKIGHITKSSVLKKLKLAQTIWKSLKEFFATTAIHCYHYLTDPERPWQERYSSNICRLKFQHQQLYE
jgi:hypothetical protein